MYGGGEGVSSRALLQWHIMKCMKAPGQWSLELTDQTRVQVLITSVLKYSHCGGYVEQLARNQGCSADWK